MNLPVAIRPMTADDAPIVYDSWLSSLADDLGIKDLDERRRFKGGQKHVVQALLLRGKSFTATAKGDPRVIGWICTEAPDVLHFVYVTKGFRTMGLCRQLVEHAGLPRVARASHSTSWGTPRVARLFETLTHHPDLGEP